MPKRTGLQVIIGQETKRIIGQTPDNEVQHDWPTSWHGAARIAILSLTAVEPLVWQLFSYSPVPDNGDLHSMEMYQYTFDGRILSTVNAEATRQEMLDGVTLRDRLFELRQDNAATPLPSHYLALACLLQQAPAITAK